MRTLTIAEARAFYDRFGAKQDAQAFYEDPALDALIAHADFEHARSVFEFGCGTGRLARRLLTTVLPEACGYLGVDVSETMVSLARERLRPWAARASVVHSDGRVPPQCEAGAYDRFVATYVLDLLDNDAIQTTIGEAHRLLAPDGRLCVVGLTHGYHTMTKLVSSVWALVHRLNPRLVGGCRPIEIRPLLTEDRWRVAHHGVVTAWGVSSEVLVAARRAESPRADGSS